MSHPCFSLLDANQKRQKRLTGLKNRCLPVTSGIMGYATGPECLVRSVRRALVSTAGLSVLRAGRCTFKPRLEKQLGSLKNWKDHAGCDLRSCFTSDDCVIGHYLLILLSLVKSTGM